MKRSLELVATPNYTVELTESDNSSVYTIISQRKSDGIVYPLLKQQGGYLSHLTASSAIEDTIYAIRNSRELIAIDVSSGQVKSLYTWQAGYINTISDTVKGSLYVTKDSILYEIRPKPDGSYVPVINEVSSLIIEFTASDSRYTSDGVEFYNSQTYQMVTAKYAPDGSLYVLGKQKKQHSKDSDRLRLFIYNPVSTTVDGGSDKDSTAEQRFIPITPYVNSKDIKYIPVNISTALIQYSGSQDWQSYNSSSFIIDTLVGSTLPLQYDSLFWTNQPSNKFELNNNIAPSSTLSVVKGSIIAGTLASSNLDALLPIQPNNQVAQISGVQAVSIGNSGHSLIYNTSANGDSTTVRVVDAKLRTAKIYELSSVNTELVSVSAIVNHENGKHNIYLLRNGHSKHLDADSGPGKFTLETTNIDLISLDDNSGEFLRQSKTLTWPASEQTHLSRLEPPRLSIDSETGLMHMRYPSFTDAGLEVNLKDGWRIEDSNTKNVAFADADTSSSPSYNYLTGLPQSQGLGGDLSKDWAFSWKIPTGIKIPTKGKYPGEGKALGGEFEFSAYTGINSLEDFYTGKWYSQASLKYKYKFGSDKIESPYQKDGLTPGEIKRNNEIAQNKRKAELDLYKEVANDKQVSYSQHALLSTISKTRAGEIDTNAKFVQTYENLLDSYNEGLFKEYENKAIKFDNKIKQIKKDQQEVSITGNLSYEESLKKGRKDQYAIKAGVELGYKRPLFNLFSFGGLYYYLTVYFNYSWENKYDSSSSTGIENGAQLSGSLGLNDLLPLVPIEGNAKQLTPEQLSRLTPEQIGYVVGFDLNNIAPEELTKILGITSSVSQLALEFMQYIPPALYITLALKLAQAAGLSGQNTVNIPVSTSLLTSLITNDNEQYLMPDLAKYYPSSAQEDIILSELTLPSGTSTGSSNRSFEIGLKETGLSAELNLGPLYFEGKVYAGVSYRSKDDKAFVPLGAKADLRIGILSYNPGIEFQWTIGGKDSLSQSEPLSSEYLNYLRSEAVGLTGGIELTTSNGQYNANVGREVGSTPGYDVQPTFDYLEYYEYGGGYIVWGTWTESIEFGSSKSGGISRLHIWNGTSNSARGEVIWRDKSVQNFTGLISDYSILGVEKKSVGKPRLVLEMNAVSTRSSDAADVVAALTSPSGYGGIYSLKNSLGKVSITTGKIASETTDDSSELGESLAFVNSTNNNALVAISSPGKAFNQGNVSLMRLSSSQLNGNTNLKSAETTFYSTQPTKKNLRVGESVDSDYAEQASNKGLSLITMSQNGGDLPNSAVGYVVAYKEGKDSPKGKIDLVRGINYDRIRPIFSLYSPQQAKSFDVANISSNVQVSGSDTTVLQSTVSYYNRALAVGTVQLTTSKYKYNTNNGYFSLDGTTNFLLTNASLQFNDSGVNKLNASSTFPHVQLSAGKSTITALGMSGRVLLLDSTLLNSEQTGKNGFDFIALDDTRGRISYNPQYLKVRTSSGYLILQYNSDVLREDLNQASITSAVLVGTYGNELQLDYRSGYEIRSTIQSVAVSNAKAEVKISPDLRLNGNDPYVISGTIEEYTPKRLQYADIAFSQLQTPLEVSAVKSFAYAKYDITDPGQGKTPWLSVATNNDNGNGMVYLITNETLLKSLINNQQTLYLDKATTSGAATFQQGIDGYAFKQGTSVTAFIHNNKEYLVIAIPHQLANASRSGALAFIEYNDKFKKAARESAQGSVPLMDAVKLINDNVVTGYLVYGDKNSILGESLQLVSNGNEQHVMSGAPGTFTSERIAKIPGYVQSYVVSSEWNSLPQHEFQEKELTKPGVVISYSKLISSRSINSQYMAGGEEQWLFYSLDKQPTDPRFTNVANQDVYAYNLKQNRTYEIKKNFLGNLIDVSSGPSNGIIATFVNTVNGQNYAVSSSYSEQHNAWLPFSYSRLDQALSLIDSNTIIDSDEIRVQRNNANSLLRHTVAGNSYKTEMPVDMKVEFDYVVIRTLDGSALAGRDYEDQILEYKKDELTSPSGNVGLDIVTSKQDDFWRSRRFFIVTDYFTRNHELIKSEKKPISIINENQDAINLSRIGIGAQLKDTSLKPDNIVVGQSAISLSNYGTDIKGSDKKSHPIAVLNSIIDSNGFQESSSLSILTYDNRNYDISRSSPYVANFAIDDNLASLFFVGGSKSYIITRSASKSNSILKLYELPATLTNLTTNSTFFQSPVPSKVSPSSTFGSALAYFNVAGVTYLAIGDPSQGTVYILSESDFNRFSDIGSTGVQVKYNTSTEFGSSIAVHGSAKNGDILFVGAPKDFSSRELGSNIDFYGGAVLALRIQDIIANYTSGQVKQIDLTSQSLNISATKLRMTPQIDLNPSSENYLRSTGSSFGSSIASADLYEVVTEAGTAFKTKGQRELIIGAPSTTLNYQAVTGAVYVLDTELGLFATDKGLNTITLDQGGFAIGNQTQIRGKLANKPNSSSVQGVVLYGTYNGDMIGNSILSLGQFTNSKFDVISLPSPSAIQQAGTVYMYIGNNDQTPLQSSILNPTSTTDHAFQYVGVSNGINYNASSTSIAAFSSNVGKFSEPLSGAQYNGDSFLINSRGLNKDDPKAYLLYGKNYLTPGSSISTSEISAGLGKPFVGNGVPFMVGDANYDGYGDFSQIGKFPQGGRIEFGIPPESTRPYPDFGLIGGDIDDGVYRAMFYKETKSPFINGALAPIKSNQLYYQNKLSNPTRNHLYRTDYTPLLDNSNEISRSTKLWDSVPDGSGLSILNGTYPLTFPIKSNRDFDFDGYIVMPDSGQIKLVRNDGFEGITYSSLLGSFIPSLAKANSGGLASVDDQINSSLTLYDYAVKNIGDAYSGKGKKLLTVDIRQLSSQSGLDNSYGASYDSTFTGSYSFGGKQYYSGYSIVSKNALDLNGRKVIYWLYNSTDNILNGLGNISMYGLHGEIDKWFRALDRRSMISPIGDFNSDGIPDLAVLKDFGNSAQSNTNPFTFAILYGMMSYGGKLEYNLNNATDVKPLPNQAGVIFSNAGDYDGSGASTLLVSALSKPDELAIDGYPKDLISFLLYPSDRSQSVSGISTQQRIKGSEGADQLEIARKDLESLNQLIISTYQGNDIISLSADLSDYIQANRTYVTLGSGDDILVLDLGLLDTFKTYKFLANGGSGINSIKLSGISSRQIDISAMLGRITNFSMIDIRDLSVKLDLDMLRRSLLTVRSPEELLPDFSDKSSIYFVGQPGSRLSVNTSRLTPIEPTTQGFNTFNGYYSSELNTNFYIQTDINLGTSFSNASFSADSTVSPFGTLDVNLILPDVALGEDSSSARVHAVDSTGALLGSASLNGESASIVFNSLPSPGSIRVFVDNGLPNGNSDSKLLAEVSVDYAKFQHPLELDDSTLLVTSDLQAYAWRIDNGDKKFSFGLRSLDGLQETLLASNALGSANSNISNTQPLGANSAEWLLTEGKFDGGLSARAAQLTVGSYQPYLLDLEQNTYSLVSQTEQGGLIDFEFENGARYRISSDSQSRTSVQSTDRYTVGVSRLGQLNQSIFFYQCDPITGIFAYNGTSYQPEDREYLNAAKSLSIQDGTFIDSLRMPVFGEKRDYIDLPLKSLDSYGVIFERDDSSSKMLSSFGSANLSQSIQVKRLPFGDRGISYLFEDLLSSENSDFDFNDIIVSISPNNFNLA